ncbi:MULTISPECIES: TMEM175 family protein [Alphaproteobacteria]|uniref:DUF1211 domain-containing protein n=1 Tax=Sphingobium limneticum TaxID=1007511 RepID=A0A5J5HV04_9SPHN|nr:MULTISPECIES: TMEM175 family protein [Alphaproteobacteria]MBJ7442478.1 DUF1211 domain-containing protein [Sphingopyxis sp.]KAA9010976.1 DUF1211 domain-containing protein [Sphingobium limneticum]KAA9011759.1 DUF1211 domain-containing protein [Sphingobium limneticum]KAA9024392.1 DUF1211 domain-containing protein [Sphingobium limneticum]TAJ34086.1 MAG: DUF1211 domain-containing protein [Bosea sp. (in: a-proteobacteria)]
MVTSSLKATERKSDRLEAFMDAVLAIAITLPAVELHAPKPEEGDLAAAYLKLAPEYGTYVLSVILISLYWAHSHFSGKLLEKTDHGYNLLSIGFLAAVSITPFPARPLVEHLGGDAESATATLWYLGVAATPATWWFLRWVYATARGLPDRRLTDAYLRRLTIKYGLTAAAYWAAFGLAFWDWRVGLIAAGILTLTYIVPPAKPSYKPGQEPENG